MGIKVRIAFYNGSGLMAAHMVTALSLKAYILESLGHDDCIGYLCGTIHV